MQDTIKKTFENFTGRLQPWAWNLIIVALAILIGLVIKVVLSALLNLYKKQTDYSLFRSIVTHIGRPLNHFVPLLVLNLMFPLMEMGQRFYDFFSRATEIALIISFSVLLMSSIKVFEDYVYHAYDLNKADNLKERKIRTQLQFVRKVVVTLIVFYYYRRYTAQF